MSWLTPYRKRELIDFAEDFGAVCLMLLGFGMIFLAMIGLGLLITASILWVQIVGWIVGFFVLAFFFTMFLRY